MESRWEYEYLYFILFYLKYTNKMGIGNEKWESSCLRNNTSINISILLLSIIWILCFIISVIQSRWE